MTRVEHEKQNRLDKARKDNPIFGIAAAHEPKTFRGIPKANLSKKSTAKRKSDNRVPCEKCGQKILPKHVNRHNFLCHDQLNCPICDEPHTGHKKIGRHIKKKHGHNAYRKFKKQKGVDSIGMINLRNRVK